MTGKAILVTGGAGFIGSHTCKLLAAAGYLPVAFDNLSRGNEKSVAWGPLVVGDIRDRAAMQAAIATYQPTAVIHFAALAYVGESVQQPAEYYSTNVAGTIAVLDAARAHAIENIIFSSSCATYGVPEALPVRESSSQNPISPYGRTKLMGEQIIGDYASAYGMKFAILRYFNACGADPDGELGEWHTPETHLVPRVLMAASGIIDEIEVFGTDYETPDGTCVRDYIHVSDLARAHLKALQHLEGGGQSLAVNLGTGQGVSIREIVQAVSRVTSRPVPAVFRARRPGDPAELYADPSKARAHLGFVPELSDIDTIVRTAAPFFGLRTKPETLPPSKAAASAR
ncbi:UDP-glucose 4-epimerase GalE [Mesorhizobium sp. M00.F.Ca.ET.151.01.1.1]|uniref:UDP-glucose 4-epimerase GalE n=1 Tax=unclassified Mesorhizobium TaxID=325217 RepID=UPI000FD5F4EC|nr:MULTISPECIES: UDP-glucose 4-epimerase GalE [unclassified Mesorhizobium]RUX03262.1 UDP-glucose 4-epimerase GalE [Mesorhizobium sp. M8A.F.Ca.ET.059.01.1.1]RVD61983.1 UDP-glucose 4-epimerase GalE [Mesorhizobium sp. M8A.F.Ca.ET.023.02.2.1]RWC70245.1 MAG: UDP-glucose 4-epimerase GalE [Mesorhizobium sp.]TGR58683.1 UDP-glucose 4-epimerase GalE [bacterium M00.F.Ca.ET.199.01.1.1]TGU41207.1 UDP-glucose 4-epimerase GalE [bacterium M00.F.Ca.ET.156.01.1.1]TGU92106.1 UDP-glucose 4-epimerase GalE [Mesorh